MNFWRQNQLSRVSLDSQSNFSGVRIDLFTDKAAILSLLDLRIIMGYSKRDFATDGAP